MMLLRFVGGAWDGHLLVRDFAPKGYHVAVLNPTARSFWDAEIDYTPERYRCVWIDREDETAVYVLEG